MKKLYVLAVYFAMCASAVAGVPCVDGCQPDPTTVPEPGTLMLMGVGLLAGIGFLRKK